MSFLETLIEEPAPTGDAVPLFFCAECGADWSVETCDTGCINDLDTSTKVEDADLPVPWVRPPAPAGARWLSEER